jgi:hypothetical protein
VTLWRKDGDASGGRASGFLESMIGPRSILRTDGQRDLGVLRRCFVAGLVSRGRSRGTGASISAAATLYNRPRRRRFIEIRLSLPDGFSVSHPSSLEGVGPCFPLL